MAELEGRVTFYRSSKERGKFQGLIRKSLKQMDSDDGDLIFRFLQDSKANPNFLPVDPKKIAKKPFFQVKLKKDGKNVSTVVSVPEPEESGSTASPSIAPAF